MARNGGRGGARHEPPASNGNLIFDWNHLDVVAPLTTKPIRLNDETLRDGIQSPSVTDPPLALKLELVDLMESLHVYSADIGLPGAGPRAFQDVLAIAKHLAKQKYRLMPNCAARTVAADIAPVAEVQQKAGIPVAAYTFIGSSPIRQYAEAWGRDYLLSTSAAAIDFAVKEGLEVCYVTEDTTRSNPATLDRLFRNAIDHGATALCLCDTVGWATPDGVRRLIHWTRDIIRGMGADVRIEWHGHNDRGLAVTNAIHAIEFGADVVHGCALGLGERVGNTALDQVLMNLRLLGAIDWDLRDLVRYVQTASQACAFPIPRNYPLSGEDAFRTATGVHAAAIVKAEKKGDRWLADRIYSGVPAGLFGKKQVIEIGPMSGLSNVVYWLKQHRLAAAEPVARAVLAHAKQRDRVLTEAEVRAALARARGAAAVVPKGRNRPARPPRSPAGRHGRGPRASS